MSWFRKMFGLGPSAKELLLQDVIRKAQEMEKQLKDMNAELEAARNPPQPDPPSLDIKDHGPQEDGTTRWEFEWNDEFIVLLRENGYEGTEEQMINEYLNRIFTRHNRPDMVNNGLHELDEEQRRINQ